LAAPLSGADLARLPGQHFCPHLVQFGANHAGNQGRYREVLLKGMQPETAIEGARESHAQPSRCFSGIGVLRSVMNAIAIGIESRGRGWVRGLRRVVGSGVLTVGQSLNARSRDFIQFATKSGSHAAR